MVEKLDNSCVVCNYPITDPICGRCYIKEVKAKLNDFGMHPLAIEVLICKLKKKVFIETSNQEICILCGKENLTLCRYCFSIILGKVLRELNFPEKLIRDMGYIEEEKSVSFL
jgi:hypothetical protein